HRTLDAEVVGHERDREADFGGGRPVGRAAKSVIGVQVTRAVAGAVEAADRFTALEEEVDEAGVLATPALNGAGDGGADECDLVGDRVIATRFSRRGDVLHVAAHAGKVDAALEEEALGRVLRVIAEVVSQRGTDQRVPGDTFRFADRQRSARLDVEYLV